MVHLIGFFLLINKITISNNLWSWVAVNIFAAYAIANFINKHQNNVILDVPGKSMELDPNGINRNFKWK